MLVEREGAKDVVNADCRFGTYLEVDEYRSLDVVLRGGISIGADVGWRLKKSVRKSRISAVIRRNRSVDVFERPLYSVAGWRSEGIDARP